MEHGFSLDFFCTLPCANCNLSSVWFLSQLVFGVHVSCQCQCVNTSEFRSSVCLSGASKLERWLWVMWCANVFSVGQVGNEQCIARYKEDHCLSWPRMNEALFVFRSSNEFQVLWDYCYNSSLQNRNQLIDRSNSKVKGPFIQSLLSKRGCWSRGCEWDRSVWHSIQVSLKDTKLLKVTNFFIFKKFNVFWFLNFN